MRQIELIPAAATPPGFVYRDNFIAPADEIELVRSIEQLPFLAPTMRGVPAKRRTVHFGFSYDFDSFKLGNASPLPEFLQPLLRQSAALAGREPGEFAEALVTEYSSGAGIGWHRDAPPFGAIVGISLLAACTMKFRPWPLKKEGATRTRPIAQILEPRSAYLLDGEVRSAWQHYIPPANALRYSITFRTLRKRPD